VDLAKDNYGAFTHKTIIEAPEIHLKDIGEGHIGKTVNLRAIVQNSRAQGAKMAFFELREIGSWTIQAIVAATKEGDESVQKVVSKQMVKWSLGLKLESVVDVEAVVQKPLEPVKSTRVSEYELHLTKVYLVQTAPEMLGLTLAAASRAAGRIEDDEDEEEVKGVEGMFRLGLLLREYRNNVRQVSVLQKEHHSRVCLHTSTTLLCTNELPSV